MTNNVVTPGTILCNYDFMHVKLMSNKVTIRRNTMVCIANDDNIASTKDVEKRMEFEDVQELNFPIVKKKILSWPNY